MKINLTIGVKKTLVLGVTALALATGCESAGKKTGYGAGIGAAAGGVLGAVIGNQSGNAAKGALIGAALGGGVGGLIGNRLDKQQKELDKIAETRRTDAGLITKLKSDILFDTGKAQLKPAANNNISQMATILKKYPEDVLTVVGYTDSTGSAATNEKLSAQRAEAVKSQIISNGVPGGTVTAKGMGPANPVGDNKTAAGRAANRRVEVEITVDESKVPKNAS